MEHMYRECELQFLDQKRFHTKEKGKHNSSTKNVVKINLKCVIGINL